MKDKAHSRTKKVRNTKTSFSTKYRHDRIDTQLPNNFNSNSIQYALFSGM